MSDAAVLSDHVKEEIDRWKARFPEDRQRSAVIGALHAVQHENKGYLPAEQMNGVADYLNLPTIQVYEVATFYSMFQTRPVGRNDVAICTNVSCMLRGAEEIVVHVEKKYGISDVSAACEQVTYTLDVVGDVDTDKLKDALEWSESVCHVVRSLKEPVPVEMHLKVNGEAIPTTQP